MANSRKVVRKQTISNSWLAHFLPSEQYAQNAQCLHFPKSREGPEAEFELSNESKFVSKFAHNLWISVAFSFTLLHPCCINPLQEGQDHREPRVWPLGRSCFKICFKIVQKCLKDLSSFLFYVHPQAGSSTPHRLQPVVVLFESIQICHVICLACRQLQSFKSTSSVSRWTCEDCTN